MFRRLRRRHKTIRWSIFQNFMVLIVMMSVAFFAAFIIVQYFQSSLVASRILDQATSRLDKELTRFFSPLVVSSKIMIHPSKRKNVHNLEIEQLNEAFVPIIQEFPQIVSINVLTARGDYFLLARTRKEGAGWQNLIARASDLEQKRAKLIKRDEAFNQIGESWQTLSQNPRDAIWYSKAKNLSPNQVYWTEPYLLPVFNEPGISLSIPMLNEKGANTVITFNVLLSDISKIVNLTYVSPKGSAFLLTNDHKLVEVSKKEYVISIDMKKEEILVSMPQSGILPLDEGYKEWQEEIGHQSPFRKSGADRVFFYTSNRTRYVGSVLPFKLYDQRILWIGAFLPINDIIKADQYHTGSLIIIFCIALLLAIWMTKKMTKRYTKPIKQLAVQSQKIARMDLKPGQPIESEIVEFQQLAGSQEQMREALDSATTDLKISNEKLEELSQTLTEKVEDRTAELSEKSAELEELNQTLEHRVKEEVEASSRKDQIMLQSARQAQMGEMISMIAHQWRQPLSSISTLAGNLLVYLELEQYDKDQFLELLTNISEHAQYLSNTINDFRNFFKPNKNKESVLLDDILEQTINIIGKSLEYKGIALEKDYHFDAPIDTYPNELTQVFLNIIKNSQDVILEKEVKSPTIKIRGYQAEGRQVVQISDNGGGISQENMGKIFEPYFSTKDEKTGTGLGLYMSKLIIEKHCHGDLEVENTEDGAKFSIIMPAD
jgi:signal transduction histidine kinase